MTAADERDYAEEAANAAVMREDQGTDLDAANTTGYLWELTASRADLEVEYRRRVADRDALAAEVEQLRAELAIARGAFLRLGAELAHLEALDAIHDCEDNAMVCTACEHLWKQHGDWGCTVDNDLGDCLCAVTSSTTCITTTGATS